MTIHPVWENPAERVPTTVEKLTLVEKIACSFSDRPRLFRALKYDDRFWSAYGFFVLQVILYVAGSFGIALLFKHTLGAMPAREAERLFSVEQQRQMFFSTMGNAILGFLHLPRVVNIFAVTGIVSLLLLPFGIEPKFRRDFQVLVFASFPWLVGALIGQGMMNFGVSFAGLFLWGVTICYIGIVTQGLAYAHDTVWPKTVLAGVMGALLS